MWDLHPCISMDWHKTLNYDLPYVWIKLCQLPKALFAHCESFDNTHITRISPSYNITSTQKNNFISRMHSRSTPIETRTKNLFLRNGHKKKCGTCVSLQELKSSQGCCKLVGLELLITTEALNSCAIELEILIFQLPQIPQLLSKA
jgi:hypothetical protein